MKKNVVVTGADGFIGRRLVDVLRMYGHGVISLGREDGDITDSGTLRKLDGDSVDAVFHLAGRTYVPASWEKPLDFQNVNVGGTINVLEFCKCYSTPLTYVSAYLYGIPSMLPISENDRLIPNNPYALSKLNAENWCSFYAENFGISITVVRPFNIYGIGQKKHFLIPEIIDQVLEGKDIQIKDLSPRRDYLYLDDLVDGLILTMGRSGYNTYNFGSGYSLSVKEIIDVIQSVAGTSLRVVSEKRPRHNEIPDVYANIGRARDELGWVPKTSFETGIKRIVNAKEKG